MMHGVTNIKIQKLYKNTEYTK